MRDTHMPPGCGEDLGKTILFNPYQEAFQEARRQRFCLVCKTVGRMDALEIAQRRAYVCKKCGTAHTSNSTAPRVYDQFSILAGRGGGKTKVGALAVAEELMIPNSIWWVMGPDYKKLNDSTFPTLIRLISPDWVKKWDADKMNLTLKNGSMVAFRSLEDPERARGPHGVSGGWFDEAAQCPERAYDVFKPTLIAAGGIVLATTTVLGFDWTWDRIEKLAMEGEPGFWRTRWWTEENPLFRSNPLMLEKIERERRTTPPEFFAQEYRAERRNAQGLVYSYELIEKQCLLNDNEIKKLIPEWPKISPEREMYIGLDSGADHPFGALLVVVTEYGLVAVAEYLQRMQALSLHLPAILSTFGIRPSERIKWAANKNEVNLRLEFGLKGIGIIPAENKHEVGIQRVSTWLHARQFYFAYTCPKTIEQMRAYRYTDNLTPDGQKKKEQVFKKSDEFPDCVRYVCMAFPRLPDMLEPLRSPAEQARWDAFDERTRQDLETLRAYKEREKNELRPEEAGYPIGSFFNQTSSQWW